MRYGAIFKINTVTVEFTASGDEDALNEKLIIKPKKKK